MMVRSNFNLLMTKAKKNERANALKEVKRYKFEIDNLRICRVNMPE